MQTAPYAGFNLCDTARSDNDGALGMSVSSFHNTRGSPKAGVPAQPGPVASSHNPWRPRTGGVQ